MNGLAPPVDTAARPSSTLRALRAATHDAHETLEQRLDLLSATLSPARLRRVLVRFESFHRTWEPRIETLIDRSDFLAPRRRLVLLQADLAALGAAPERGPGPDLSWLVGETAAWGSLYVLEGSTLGGQVITKALSARAGNPAAAVTYFNSRGGRTGAFWRETTQALEAQGLADRRDEMIAAAIRTFEVLADWVAPEQSTG